MCQDSRWGLRLAKVHGGRASGSGSARAGLYSFSWYAPQGSLLQSRCWREPRNNFNGQPRVALVLNGLRLAPTSLTRHCQRPGPITAAGQIWTSIPGVRRPTSSPSSADGKRTISRTGRQHARHVHPFTASRDSAPCARQGVPQHLPWEKRVSDSVNAEMLREQFECRAASVSLQTSSPLRCRLRLFRGHQPTMLCLARQGTIHRRTRVQESSGTRGVEARPHDDRDVRPLRPPSTHSRPCTSLLWGKS